METIRKNRSLTVDGEINIEKWLEQIAKRTERSSLPYLTSAVDLVAEHAFRKRLATGITCFEQGLGMVELLVDLISDEESLAAAMVYNAFDEKCLIRETVSERLSPRIYALIDATRQMKAFQLTQEAHNLDTKDKQHVEKLRKILLALVKDPRCILIKLAERILILRYADHLPLEKQRSIANETKAIHAPLANRLGIGQFKWKLEDLSFRYLAPKVYREIAEQLNDKRSKREEDISSVIMTLKESIAHKEVSNFTVTGRVKHIFSIWHKMRRKNVSFEEIYDVRAIRIIVEKEGDCYIVLGVVHSLWQHVPQEFDDYIASPKQNGYQSLHTAVVGPEGKLLEIQVRTWRMHEESELGVAAHWRYKESGKIRSESILEKRIAWLRRLIEWQQDESDYEAFVEEMRTEFLQDRIYVFTPKKEVLDLPKGSTPLDFAYAIHSEVGHRCRGSQVNGRMVPLNYQLHTGDEVNIITIKEAKPSRDWMIRYKGYVRTSKARSLIRRWFKRQDFEKNLQEGKNLLERELKRIGIRKVDYAALAEHFRFKDQDGFFASLGAGDVRLIRALHAAQSLTQPDIPEEQMKFSIPPEKKGDRKNPNDVQIYGADDLLTKTASCCKPVPGDAIVGYMTQGRGISIHRQSCKNIKAFSDSSPERILDVSWADGTQEVYTVDVSVKAYERAELINDINKEIGNESAKLLGMTMNTNRKDHTIEISMAVGICNLNNLGKLLAKIGQVKNVIYAMRQ